MQQIQTAHENNQFKNKQLLKYRVTRGLIAKFRLLDGSKDLRNLARRFKMAELAAQHHTYYLKMNFWPIEEHSIETLKIYRMQTEVFSYPLKKKYSKTEPVLKHGVLLAHYIVQHEFGDYILPLLKQEFRTLSRLFLKNTKQASASRNYI